MAVGTVFNGKTTLEMKVSSVLDLFVLLITGVKACLCPERSRKYERKQMVKLQEEALVTWDQETET